MKLSIFLTLALLLACTSTRTMSRTSSFTFSSMRQVFADRTPSQKEILSKYGEPDKKRSERWSYLDSTTQLERVHFVFNQTKELVQLIWIPLPGEEELKLERIIEKYPAGYFKFTNRTRTSSHNLATDTTYSGDSVAILNDDAAREVTAVAWFNPPTKSQVTSH